MTIKPFKPIDEALELLNTAMRSFDPSVAPRRYHELVKRLHKRKKFDIRGAIVIYGLRRTGKTASILDIAKRAKNNAGYEVYYTDLDNPEFDPEGNSAKDGSILAAARELANIALKKKLLVIVDEAFVASMRTIHKFLEMFKRPYDEKREFVVVLLGSYGVDLERLRSYLYRTIKADGFYPVIPSTPRACAHKEISPSRDVIEALSGSPENPLRSDVVRDLERNGLFERGRVGRKAGELYEKYRRTLGMPEAMLGIKSADEILNGFPDLLEESIFRFKSIVKSSKDEAKKYSRITNVETIKRLVSVVGGIRRSKIKEEELKLVEFALNLGIVLPRRFLRLESDDPIETLHRIARELNALSLADILSNYEMQPIPAHLFGYELIKRYARVYGSAIPASMAYESIAAHALISHAFRANVSRGIALMSRLPIFSARGIDFVYPFVDSFGAKRAVAIEVKSGDRISEIVSEGFYSVGERDELDNAIKTSEELGIPLTLVVPHELDEVYIGKRTLPIDIQGEQGRAYVLTDSILLASCGCLKKPL